MVARGGVTAEALQSSALEFLPIAEWVAREAGRMIREVHAIRNCAGNPCAHACIQPVRIWHAHDTHTAHSERAPNSCIARKRAAFPRRALSSRTRGTQAHVERSKGLSIESKGSEPGAEQVDWHLKALVQQQEFITEELKGLTDQDTGYRELYAR